MFFKKSKIRDMKKVWGLMAAICILLSVSGQAYGQSLKDLLNSSTVACNVAGSMSNFLASSSNVSA